VNGGGIGGPAAWRKGMATIPIYGRFIGDFTAHLVAVDTEDTIDEVAAKIARHVIGRRLPEQPDAQGLEVLTRNRCNGWTFAGNGEPPQFLA
jgi:toluene monooxygenase system protein B